MNNIFITGANGFIGHSLAQHFHGEPNVIPLTRSNFDLTNPAHYTNYSFDNALIVDCIARIDGSPEMIEATNVYGLESFLTFLASRKTAYRYLYFSTLSTLDAHLSVTHPYVASKFKAEALIRKMIPDYKIIRLSYPFGAGESSNRLISRLIHKILNEEPVTIDDIQLHLTPVNDLTNNFEALMDDVQKEINFAPEKACHLKDVLEHIYTRTGKQSLLTVRPIAGNAEQAYDFYPVQQPTNIYTAIDALIEQIQRAQTDQNTVLL